MNIRRFLSGIFYSIGDAFDSAKVSPRRGTPPGEYPTDAKKRTSVVYQKRARPPREVFGEKFRTHTRNPAGHESLRHRRRYTPKRKKPEFRLEQKGGGVFQELVAQMRHYEQVFVQGGSGTGLPRNRRGR